MKKHSNLILGFLLVMVGIGSANAQWYSPEQYQNLLGHGMDVEWWTNGQDYGDYDYDVMGEDFAASGIQHVRITIERDVMSRADFMRLDRQINSCLRHGIAPIIAYRPQPMAHYGNPRRYHDHLVNWWHRMADHCRAYSGYLAFDLLYEPNATMFASAALLNDFYDACVADIRISNPRRIIFIAPSYYSDPMHLVDLRIPRHHNGYLMAEWHFLSQGNSYSAWDNWRLRGDYQRRWVNDRVAAALAWQRATGIRTWVGGWATGAYFNSSDAALMASFTALYCDALVGANIPFAVWDMGRHYDPRNRGWHDVMREPMQHIFPNHAWRGVADAGRRPEPNRPAISNPHPERQQPTLHIGANRSEQPNRDRQPGFHIGNVPQGQGMPQGNRQESSREQNWRQQRSDLRQQQRQERSDLRQQQQRESAEQRTQQRQERVQQREQQRYEQREQRQRQERQQGQQRQERQQRTTHRR